MKKYIITLSSNGQFLRTERYENGDQYFFTKEVVNGASLIISKKPRKFKGQNTIIKDHNGFMTTPSVVQNQYIEFPDQFDPKTRKEIQKIFDEYGFMPYHEDFTSESETIEVVGDYDVHEVEERKLTLFTGSVEHCVMPLTKLDYERIKTDGMPHTTWQELESNTEESGPILTDSSTLYVNDEEVSGAHDLLAALFKEHNELEGAVSKSVKATNARSAKYAARINRWTKRTFYSLKIYEVFDQSKVSLTVATRILIGDKKPVITFQVSYDGKELEFESDLGSNSEDIYLTNWEGHRSDFEIHEEEEEEEEEEDDEDSDD